LDKTERVRLLLIALADQSWRVRKTAQEILLQDFSPEEYVPGLIGLLYMEDNAGARNAAIETLISLNRRATPYLVEAFREGDTEVRKFIIDILGEFRDRSALQVMLSALEDEDENVRASAVEHLGKLKEPTVVEALIDILEKGELWTAYPAADALGRIGDRRAIPALIGALPKKAMREPIIKALSLLGGGDILKYLVPLLKDSARSVREETLKALERLYKRGVSEEEIGTALKGAFGDESINMLAEHAWGNKPEVRVSAILVLGLLKDEKAVPKLLEIAQEEEFSGDAGRALAFISREKPGILLQYFKSENPYIKRFVVKVAGSVALPLYYGPFTELLKDEDGHVRALAAKGLAAIGEGRAAALIFPLLRDPYADVQEEAVSALLKLKEALKEEDLLEWAASREASLRKNAAILIGKTLKDEKAISALGFALKDENQGVRRAVVAALGEIATPAAIKYLFLALTDESPEIRAAAALNLGGAASGEEALEKLRLLLSDSEDMVKAAAIKAFGMLGEKKTIPYFIGSINDPNGFVVTTVINALGRIKGPEAEKALLDMLASPDREIVRTAIKALAGFEGAARHLVPFLKDPDWATRMAAVQALGEQGGAAVQGGALDELRSLLDTEEDPAVKKSIERLLANV
jgi:HEAT repeat protein